MFKRQIAEAVQQAHATMPIVTILGPRQSGKTTLARSLFPKKPYLNFERLDLRSQALEDPAGFLQRYKEGAIFDEVQEVPELLSYLLPLVDEDGRNGLFILTGSHQMKVKEKVTQTLAGRTAIFKLYPLSLYEMEAETAKRTVEKSILFGGYPRAQSLTLPLTNLFSSYYQTYIERDVAALSRIHNLHQFGLFVRFLAGRVGQLVNLDGIGAEVGISAPTVREWLSLLEASYLIFRLPPYYENFGKRLIKSPKIYFTDTGIACYLLGIETEDQLQRDPLRGSLFENLVILELLKDRSNHGLDSNLYFYRDSQGKEVDLLFQRGRELVPVEIKISQTFNSSFLDTLQFFHKLAEIRAPKSYLVYGGSSGQVHSTTLLPYSHAREVLH